MAISVTWPTGVIFVPKADTTLVGTDPISGREIRSFDTEQFHEDLRDAEESVDGRAWPLTHFFNAEATLGGTTYVPQLILINNYQVEFESIGTPWRVVFTSTNNNIADFSVVNDVSIQPGNSAGLQKVTTGVSGLTTTESLTLIETYKLMRNRREININTGVETIYDDDGVTPLFTRPVWVDVNGTIQYDGTVVPHRVDRYT